MKLKDNDALKGVEVSKALIESCIENIDACMGRIDDIYDDIYEINKQLRKLLK